MSHVYDNFKDTPLWRAVAAAVTELAESREIAVATAPDYVIGYICQQLVAARVTGDHALAYDP